MLTRVVLREVEISRGSFRLQATGTFSEGLHLVRGPIGCGKTTLSLLLADLLPLQSGEVEKEGIHRQRLLMQFPEYQITSHTLTEEVESWGGVPEEVLTDLDIPDRKDEDPLTLSRGELKRLLLQTFLRTDPDLLLLDEPFAGLDCRERGRMIDALSGRASRITILFSHDTGRLPSPDHLWAIRSGLLIDQKGSTGYPDTERSYPSSASDEGGDALSGPSGAGEGGDRKV